MLLLCSIFLLQTLTTTAHVCILHPPQRGPLNVTTPGDPSCYRRTENCHGIISTGRVTPLVSGSTTSILVHQNLNHWVPPTNTQTSGYFTLTLTAATNATNNDAFLLDTWSDFPAWDEVSQTNFTRTVTIPTMTGAAVLSFAYISYNVDEVDPPTNTDAIFYNCADVVIVAAADAAVVDSPARPNTTTTETTTDATSFSCSTPAQWSAQGIETLANGQFLNHHIVVDAVHQQMYYSREQSMSSSATSSSFPIVTTISNYTSGREYVLTENGKKCAIYGPDKWYPLNFGGVANGMSGGVEIATNVFGFQGAAIAGGMKNGISWTVRFDKATNTCLPLSRVTPSSSLQWTTSQTLAVIPKNQFAMPAVCAKATATLNKLLRQKGVGVGGKIPGCGFVV